MGYEIYLMIELAKSYGLIKDDLEYDLAWSEGQKLYEKFTNSEFNIDSESEYNCIEKFLTKENEGLQYDVNLKSDIEEIELNINAVKAYLNDDTILATTIWSLISLKGYKRLDTTMNIKQMETKLLKLI